MSKQLKCNHKRALLTCALFFTFLFGFSADRTEDKPRVGLVLSGGGAKGIAHIGVIQALEENDIPIDCVAGTSAGAIVGSLYACGWTPEEILDLFTSKNFKYWSNGTISPSNVYYEMAPEELPTWFDVGLNVGNDSHGEDIFSQIIPTNLISPIPMNLEFLELYTPYTSQCKGDFNNLFVPLRTVCSDVYHKHKIVCKSGSLGDAVRASMSFPLVFKPIEMDGVLVYDGGIYDNFPVDVMHDDFNPDFIIGVSVSAPDGKPQPNNLYSQLEDLIIQNNDYNLPEEWGVKIQVPVLDFGVFDWSDAKEIYDIGYKTGLSMVDSIKSRCSFRSDAEALREKRRAFKESTPIIEFDSVVVEGAAKNQEKYIKSLFTKDKNAPLDMEDVSKSYYRAVAERKLLDLFPQARFNDDWTSPSLLLRATVKQPWTVGAGGWITSSVHSQLFLTMGYHTLAFNSLDVDVCGWVGQSYYAGMVSGRISLNTTNPSSFRLLGVVSKQKYYENELLFFQNSTPNFVNEAQQFIRVEYETAINKLSKGYGKISYGHILDEYSLENLQNNIKEKVKTDYRATVLELGYKANSLSNQMYAMSGRLLNANIIGVFERKKTDTGNKIPEIPDKYKSHLSLSAKIEWKNFFPLHNNFIIGGMAEGLMTLSKPYESYMATLIHSVGFAPTPSTRNYFNPAFRAENYIAFGVIPIWNPVQKFQLRGDFYFYTPVRNLVEDGYKCRYDGWFRKAEFIGEVAAVYNFKFASLSLYCNYLTYPARNWNFGLNLGLLYQAPRLIR